MVSMATMAHTEATASMVNTASTASTAPMVSMEAMVTTATATTALQTTIVSRNKRKEPWFFTTEEESFYSYRKTLLDYTNKKKIWQQ